MVYIKYLVFLFSLYTTFAHAQKENYNWVFGQKAGLTWNFTQTYTGIDQFGTAGGNINFTDIPSSFVSSMTTSEGCFNVSDSKGKLLFYSDGINIWERKTPMTTFDSTTDSYMTNGRGLTGNSSSAQSGVILPYPGKNNSFIALALNTIDGLSSDILEEDARKFLTWSTIEFETEGNKYQIPEGKKNQIITPPTGQFFKEIVNAVRHANKTDYWIIAPSRKFDKTTNRNFYKLSVFKVDENGVSSEPTLQNNNLPYLQTNIVTHFTSYGQIKFNKAGNRFALITHNRDLGATVYNNLLIAEFNNVTGEITILSERSIGIANEQTYSVEFDPTDQYVYITSLTNTPSQLESRKYTLYVFSVNDLINTQLQTAYIKDYGIKSSIGSIKNSDFFGSISRGVDNRLYIVENETRNVFIIPNPEDPSNLKIYKLTNILQENTSGRLGLPNYATFFINSTSELIENELCKDLPFELQIKISLQEGSNNYNKIRINWGDNSLPITGSLSPNITTNPDQMDQFSIIHDETNNELLVKIKHKYKDQGKYSIQATILDQNNTPHLETRTNQLANVHSCQIKVNPHIRINL